MATKMCFKVNETNVFDEEVVAFTYVKGMAFSQKCKNVLSFHSSIQAQFPNAKILEINDITPAGTYIGGGILVYSAGRSSKVKDYKQGDIFDPIF